MIYRTVLPNKVGGMPRATGHVLCLSLGTCGASFGHALKAGMRLSSYAPGP